MSKEFDDFVKRLQDQIFKETREVYGDIAFQRWMNPLYVGPLENPDGYGRVTGLCGDTMEFFLKIENGIVKKVSFQTDGCGSSTVCGSFAAELSLGQRPDEILNITGEAILKKLGGLPEEDEHCAFLAAEALHKAINDVTIQGERTRKL